MKRRIIIIAVLALVIGAFIPMSQANAMVAGATIEEGTNGTPYDLSTLPESAVLMINTTDLVELTGNGGSCFIVCTEGANVELIDVTVNSCMYPMYFEGTGNVLTITGTNTLTADTNNDAIEIREGGELTINGTGVLNAIGGAGTVDPAQTGGAGIGGCDASDGTITINITAGTINATGGVNSAGIGGGNNASAIVNISGGTVTATGGYNGAGIGGGASGTGTVTITGGEVYAEGGDSAQDIGNGASGEGGAVKIGVNSVVFTKNNSNDHIINYNHQYRTSGTITVAEGADYGSAYGYSKVPASWGNGNSAYAYIPMTIDTSMRYKFTNVSTNQVMQHAEGAAEFSYVGVGENQSSICQSFTLAYYKEEFSDQYVYQIKSQENPQVGISNNMYEVMLRDVVNVINEVYFTQDDEGNISIFSYRENEKYAIGINSGTTAQDLSWQAYDESDDGQKWTLSYGEKYEVVNNKYCITTYRNDKSKEFFYVYYGASTDTGLKNRYKYDESGLKTELTSFNTAGKRSTLTKYYDNGKAQYKYFYNTATNVKKSMMSYSESGVQIAKTEYYENGVSAKKQYVYYATGKKKTIKNYRTNKKLSSQTWFYTDGTSKKQFNTYDANGNLTSVSKYYMNGSRYYYKKY